MHDIIRIHRVVGTSKRQKFHSRALLGNGPSAYALLWFILCLYRECLFHIFVKARIEPSLLNVRSFHNKKSDLSGRNSLLALPYNLQSINYENYFL